MDSYVPDLDSDGRHGLPYPHVPVDVERFQPRIRVQPVGDWVEVYASFVDTRLLQSLDHWRFSGSPRGIRLESTAKDPEDCARASAQRRQKQIRLHCINAKVDRMLTLTTRPFGRNLTKPEFLRAVTLFNQGMIAISPRWNYVSVVEVQPVSKQFHLHAGIRGRYDVDQIRLVWRTALNKVWGRDLALLDGEDSPGAAHIKYASWPAHLRASASVKIASYISKYIGKDTDATEFNRKGYFCRRDNVVPKPLSFFYSPRDTLQDSLDQFIADYTLQAAMESARTTTRYLDKARNRIFIRLPKSLYNPPPF